MSKTNKLVSHQGLVLTAIALVFGILGFTTATSSVAAASSCNMGECNGNYCTASWDDCEVTLEPDGWICEQEACW